MEDEEKEKNRKNGPVYARKSFSTVKSGRTPMYKEYNI